MFNMFMLKYLLKIPIDVLGHNLLGFLNLIDILQWENASASRTSQQFLRAILPYCPPIIAMTAFSMHEEREEFLKAGLDDFISKPIKANTVAVISDGSAVL